MAGQRVFMQRLGIYLFRQLLIAFVFATLAVTFVVLFTQLFRLLSIVINNSATVLVFINMLALSVPTFLPVVLPLGLGIATLFAYHRLAVDSELVVMGASGISPLRLARPALVLGVLITILCYAFTLVLTPKANRDLVSLQYKVRDSYAVFLSKPGSFNDIADGFTFFVKRRGANGTMEGILIHDVRRPESPITIMADTGQVINSNGQPQMIVFNGRRQEMDVTSGRLSELTFEQYVIDMNALHSNTTTRLPDPREQTVFELLNPSADMLKMRTSREHLMAELHQRLASPLLCLSYLLIGLAAILAGEFNRRGLGQRILTASITIIVVQATFMSLANVIVKHDNLAFILYIAALLPGATCFYLLRGNEAEHSTAPSSTTRVAT
jgi:lipopolysaccharide export system permease protein